MPRLMREALGLQGTNWNTSATNVATVSGFAFNDNPDNGTEVGGDGKVVVYYGAPDPSETNAATESNLD